MRIYLDYNATAPLRPEARAALEEAFDRAGGGSNPSSPHAFGHEARLQLERSRAGVAELLNADPREIVFVSGGTEADNLAIRGAAGAALAARGLPGGVLASAVEHPAVLEPVRQLGREGWRQALLPVDSTGRLLLEALEPALAGDTALVCLMAANNETGVIQPVAETAARLRDRGARRPLLLTDAVQAAGRIPLDVRSLGSDLVSIASHKLGGPAGIGALWIREGVRLEPLLRGGGQERKVRPGTEPVALAAGFAAAARAARRDLREAAAGGLQRRLESGLKDLFGGLPGFGIHGETVPRLPNTTSVALPGLKGETVVIQLDLAGVAIATGSACSTGASRPSHVLEAMGIAPEPAASTIRISHGHASTAGDIDACLAALAALAPARARSRDGAFSEAHG